MNRGKIAITGANGFVGSVLYNFLVNRNYDVVKMVRYPRVGEFYFDLSDDSLGLDYLENIDTIVHCASIIDQGNLTDDEMMKINAYGTKNLFKQSEKFQVQNFINISTGGVYGNTYYHEINEVYECDPSSAYAISKLRAEQFCDDISKVRVMHLRLFFPYGNSQRGRLIPNLVTNVVMKKELRCNMNGMPRINPIHIDDVVQYIEWAINSNASGIYNIAGSEIKSISEIIDKISTVVKEIPKVVMTEKESANYIGDITKIVVESKIVSSVKLEDGLKRMIDELMY